MVEFQLDPLRAEPPKDIYVSVRVGEVQKLSRFTGSRKYNFNKVADATFGRIEVFRRVGACSFDIESLNRGSREVDVSCSDAVCKTLGLRIGLAGAPGAPPAARPALKPERHDAAGAKAAAAKEYLERHGIEVRLSEAMLAVLQERPQDPLEFLSKYLLSARASVAAAPAPASPAGKAEAPAQGGSPHGSPRSAPPPSHTAEQPSGTAAAAEASPVVAPAVAVRPVGPSFTSLPSVASWFKKRPTCMPQWPPVLRALRGLPALTTTSVVEACEVERVLTRAFFRLPAELAGQYFPLPGSDSYVPRLGGMSAQEAARLGAQRLLFTAPVVSGRGVFESATAGVVVWVNEQDHLSFFMTQALPDAEAKARLSHFEEALEQALAQDGHGLVLGGRKLLNLRGFPSASTMSSTQASEVERVLTRALSRLPSTFAGEYLPLRGSSSHAPRPDGMTALEAAVLAGRQLLFAASPPSGRGVFESRAAGVAAWVNEQEHLCLFVPQAMPSGEAATRLARFETALEQALAEEGHALE